VRGGEGGSEEVWEAGEREQEEGGGSGEGEEWGQEEGGGSEEGEKMGAALGAGMKQKRGKRKGGCAGAKRRKVQKRSGEDYGDVEEAGWSGKDDGDRAYLTMMKNTLDMLYTKSCAASARLVRDVLRMDCFLDPSREGDD
jgi:hypothetical protein